MTTTAVPRPSAQALGGPVSAVLEEELYTKVREQGVIVWLDQAGDYRGFVDRLKELRAAGELSYDVHAFRGSHLALLLALDGAAAGVERACLVIYLPGFNTDTVKQTPMFEFYKAGKMHQRALGTLVTTVAAGRVRPDQIAAFVEQFKQSADEQAAAKLTLAAADAWLSALTRTDDGFAAQLQGMELIAVFHDLITGGAVAARIRDGNNEAALWERFRAWIGLPQSWREDTLPPGRPHAADVAFAAASWALCVEYADDLKRPPHSDLLRSAADLPKPVIGNCRAVAAYLRAQYSEFYQRTADETEALLADEIEKAQAEDLGDIDTFRFEEDKVLKAALAALDRATDDRATNDRAANDRAAYDQAAAWAGLRVGTKPENASFWLQDDPARQSTWQLVGEAARLGQALARAGDRIGVDPADDGGLAAAVGAYVERGAAVDQAHRHLEQRRASLLYPQLPEFETLRARLNGMRRAWRAWADSWGRDFNALCAANGFLPQPAQQQRTLFDEVVRPLTQEPGTTAFFVVDALRFEMGAELFRELDGTPATTALLRPRLAELPTITAVGMNALAPVARNGRLHIALASDSGGVRGFQTGEFRVSDPESRRRAMHDRVGGGTCPWLTLDQVVNGDSASLKRSIAQARLVVVHSTEIDNAGEKGVGLAAFDQALQQLRAAWRLLREAGVRRFVFTSDHGFLLLDPAAPGQPHGRPSDPRSRHVFSPVAADHAGEIRVALVDLRYEGANTNVIFPEGTTIFDTGRRRINFAHGGNSLQERVIPVLTVVHRAAVGGSSARYAITAEAREDVAGMHCLEARVDIVAEQTLDFGGPKEIELALRVPDAAGVQVELCQARGKARIADSVVVATVGEPFELFFRLAGTADARALVELHHPSALAEVTPGRAEARFAVTVTSAPAPPPAAATVSSTEWLEQFPDPGIRQVFAHLAAHGTVTEEEAAAMLGGPRGLRRFAVQFEEHAKKALFDVRIDVVAGVKRYVREGSG